MKDIILLTKKVNLQFNTQDIAIFKLNDLIEEIEKEYKIMDPHPSVALFENFQLVTFKVVQKNTDSKKPLGFSFTKEG